MPIHGLLAALAVGAAVAQDQPDTGEHPDWPRWCGKVYQAGYPSFEPGGRTVAPPTNGSTYLHMQFKPRYSLYLSTEARASFVVNAALSPWFGEEYANSTTDGVSTDPFTELVFSINLADDNTPLVESRIGINTTGLEFEFDLTKLKPRTSPYDVVLFGASVYGDRNYTATSELLYLPDNPEGSATKIDNAKGGLLFKNVQTGNEFVPLLPYGYYGLYNGSNDTAASDEFVRDYTSGGKGLNAIVSLAGFADTNPVYDSMDAQGLHFMFDLRGSYKNLTETEQRVNTIKHHTSLFAYWTADEPDGWQVPFDKTPAAQALIHTLDPYHPVVVTLNCQDYYFGAYSAGGDVLMEDVYPIGINSTFSKWGTACNATLGDCGCDNCAGAVQDVAARLDDLARYEAWLGRWPKTKFHNPQVFHGEDYWFRDPTVAEARAMNALAFHRGAVGIFGWTWPSSAVLFDAHSHMASVVTAAPVRDFLLAGKPGPLAAGDYEFMDAAFWVDGDRMMVSVVNGGYDDIESPVLITLPAAATSVESVAFGGLPWQLMGGQLAIDTLPAMSTSFIILNLKTLKS
ncbi:putative glycoside hydrolase subgroup catalytic core protein [Rosellinia necatrix]|uniref:Putative glycoside hydrolase subgroup catalytic core protein n=1 Tax=Rosellinia necatrix TaxID=77044 RepID=A0A1W2THF8_ROSNE|nr:putative glycoside hydrolase subgroup catalytic core protein [Rosellinia necatrix]